MELHRERIHKRAAPRPPIFFVQAFTVVRLPGRAIFGAILAGELQCTRPGSQGADSRGLQQRGRVVLAEGQHGVRERRFRKSYCVEARLCRGAFERGPVGRPAGAIP